MILYIAAILFLIFPFILLCFLSVLPSALSPPGFLPYTHRHTIAILPLYLDSTIVATFQS